MHDTPYAITPSDMRGPSKRVHSAPVAINPDRDLDALDRLTPEVRLQLFTSIALASTVGAEE